MLESENITGLKGEKFVNIKGVSKGTGTFYRAFTDYIQFPSFEDYLNDKSKFNKFQYDGLRNYLLCLTIQLKLWTI